MRNKVGCSDIPDIQRETGNLSPMQKIIKEKTKE